MPSFFKTDVVDEQQRLGLMMPQVQGRLEKFYRFILLENSSPIMTVGYAERVRNALKKTHGVKLPDIMVQQAFTELMIEEVAEMNEPAKDLIEDVEQYMTALISILVDRCFSRYPTLCEEVQEIVGEMFEDSKKKCLDHLALQLEMEDDPFTLNDYYSENVKKIFAKLDIVPNEMGTDEEARKIMYKITCERTIDMNTQTKYQKSSSQADESPLLFRTVKELQVRLWAYRKVVHKRFCDQIAQRVRHQFPRRISEHLNSELRGRLLGTDFMRLMREPPEQALARQALEESVARLELSLQELKRL